MLPGLLEVVISLQRSRNGGKYPSQPRSNDQVVIGFGDGRLGRRIQDVGDLGRAVYLSDAALDNLKAWRLEGRDIMESSPRLCGQLLAKQGFRGADEMVWTKCVSGRFMLPVHIQLNAYSSRRVHPQW